MLVYTRMLEDMNLIVEVNHRNNKRSDLTSQQSFTENKDFNFLMPLWLIVVRAVEDNRMYVSQNIFMYLARELTIMIIVRNIHPLVIENNSFPIRVAV